MTNVPDWGQHAAAMQAWWLRSNVMIVWTRPISAIRFKGASYRMTVFITLLGDSDNVQAA